MSPLIVTVRMDDEAQARFDRERAALFPPGRTVVGAHLTLFHAVPAELRAVVVEQLHDEARRSSFPVRVTEVVSLGRGVAYRLESAELTAIHSRLQRSWRDRLTRQDAQPFRPHVTVQNKVTAEQARRTHAQLREGFAPFSVEAVALQLWRYDDGPWTHLQDFELT